jgi:hypothetical protein
MQEKHPPLQDGFHKLSEQLLQSQEEINHRDTGMLYDLWSYCMNDFLNQLYTKRRAREHDVVVST